MESPVDLDRLPFGAVLQYFRRAALQTQEELARLVGYQPTLISMIERGQRFIKRESVEDFAAALGLLPEERAALLAAHARTAASRAARRVNDRQTHDAPADAPPDDSRTLGPLVAREPELARLTKLLHGLRMGGSPWVVLGGEPGIGKTRLALEVLAQARSDGLQVALGHCYREQQPVAYTPFVEILEQIVRMMSDTLRQDFPVRWPLVSRLLPGVAPALSAAPASSASQIGVNAVDQQGFFWQVADFLRAAMEERPHVVFLDDLHWADETSLDLLLYLGRFQRNLKDSPNHMPLWLIGTYRDTEMARHPVLRRVVHALEKDHLAERMLLTPLTDRQTTDLLNAYLPSGTLAAEVSDRIYQIVGGVPFAVVGLLQGMRARGDLAPQDDIWRQTGSGEIELPSDIVEEIREHVGRLQPPTQGILRDASVLGEVFAAATVQRMGDYAPGEVEDALTEAEEGGLIRSAEREGYRFEHALVQRAIYTAIATPQRRRLHHAAALALAAEPARRGRAAELAWHFREGDDLPDAMRYSLAAGDEAESAYAHKDAQQHYLMAVSLARDLDDQNGEALALERLADVHYLLGLFNEAFENLSRATTIYRMLRNWERLAWATCQMAKVCDVLGRTPESMRFLDALLDILITVANGQQPDAGPEYPDALEERVERAVSVLSEGVAARVFLCMVARLVYLGRFREVYSLSIATITHARRANIPRIESLTYAFRGMAQARLGLLDDAGATLRIALRTAATCGDLESTFLALADLGALHQQRAELQPAREMLLRTLEALEQLGDTLRTSTSLYYLGVNAFALGDWAEARARYEAALALGARSDRMEAHSARRGLLQLDLAEGKRPLTAHLMREEAARVYQREDLVYQLYTASSVLNLEILAGFAVEARTCLRQTLASRSDDDPTTCDDLALLAWAELELGDLAAAHVALDEARRRAEAFGSRLVFVLIWRIEGRLALVEQRYQEGLAVVEQAMALAQAMPYPYAEAQARYVAGLLHQTRGEDVKARQAFSAALAIFQRLGERFYAGRIERELAALG